MSQSTEPTDGLCFTTLPRLPRTEGRSLLCSGSMEVRKRCFSIDRVVIVVAWVGAGSGCSSLGYGAMEELGPFRVMSDGKTLYRNPYAWNEVANVLTATDTLVFLVNWFEQFPEYTGRDFFITSESYAGHYVPQLAHAILNHKDRLINLKGIAIGNAVINKETDSKGTFDYWMHALIADETIRVIHKFGNFSSDAPWRAPECDRAIDEANLAVEKLDVYNIYAPLCFSLGVTPTLKSPSIENFDPCTSNYVEAYLNNLEVQKALHANITKLNCTWSGCSQVIPSWSDQPPTMLPIIHELLSNGIRVLKYSGDCDGVVPVTSIRYSLKKLKLKVKALWRAWMLNSEVNNCVVSNLFIRYIVNYPQIYKLLKMFTLMASFPL
ncbi:hypothetical protein ZIOFF_060524 [Zingiber officinale]|uniref:Carboxypeptidase n=1 Tax=Zingiber officinale TaxID=94328 RepID=A0A8J5FAV0_ZINOF|nr:hypothetical protein ZIOFF_060524 [Zingiber officinale]